MLADKCHAWGELQPGCPLVEIGPAMSPQTYPTIKHEDRTVHSATRTRARTSTVLAHEMTVVASSVADVVAAAGGWLYDRRMAGWRVNVVVPDRGGRPALQILGAEMLDPDGDFDEIADVQGRVDTVVVATDVYANDERVRRFVSRSDRSRAEVVLWGDLGSLGVDASAVCYRLSAAARAFKAQALLAAGLPCDAVATTEALYRCGVTALVPVATRS